MGVKEIPINVRKKEWAQGFYRFYTEEEEQETGMTEFYVKKGIWKTSHERLGRRRINPWKILRHREGRRIREDERPP